MTTVSETKTLALDEQQKILSKLDIETEVTRGMTELYLPDQYRAMHILDSEYDFWYTEMHKDTNPSYATMHWLKGRTQISVSNKDNVPTIKVVKLKDDEAQQRLWFDKHELEITYRSDMIMHGYYYSLFMSAETEELARKHDTTSNLCVQAHFERKILNAGFKPLVQFVNDVENTTLYVKRGWQLTVTKRGMTYFTKIERDEDGQ